MTLPPLFTCVQLHLQRICSCPNCIGSESIIKFPSWSGENTSNMLRIHPPIYPAMVRHGYLLILQDSAICWIHFRKDPSNFPSNVSWYQKITYKKNLKSEQNEDLIWCSNRWTLTKSWWIWEFVLPFAAEPLAGQGLSTWNRLVVFNWSIGSQPTFEISEPFIAFTKIWCGLMAIMKYNSTAYCREWPRQKSQRFWKTVKGHRVHTGPPCNHGQPWASKRLARSGGKSNSSMSRCTHRSWPWQMFTFDQFS